MLQNFEYRIRMIYKKKDILGKLSINYKGSFENLNKYKEIDELFYWNRYYYTPIMLDQNNNIVYDEKEKMLIINMRRKNEKLRKEVLCKIVVRNINFINITKESQAEGYNIPIDFKIDDLSEGILYIGPPICGYDFNICLKSYPLYIVIEDIYDSG